MEIPLISEETGRIYAGVLYFLISVILVWLTLFLNLTKFNLEWWIVIILASTSLLFSAIIFVRITHNLRNKDESIRQIKISIILQNIKLAQKMEKEGFGKKLILPKIFDKINKSIREKNE